MVIKSGNTVIDSSNGYRYTLLLTTEKRGEEIYLISDLYQTDPHVEINLRAMNPYVNSKFTDVEPSDEASPDYAEYKKRLGFAALNVITEEVRCTTSLLTRDKAAIRDIMVQMIATSLNDSESISLFDTMITAVNVFFERAKTKPKVTLLETGNAANTKP